MIPSTGIFLENEYFKETYALESAEPDGMGRFAATATKRYQAAREGWQLDRP